MGAVFMHMDPLYILAVNIPGDMIPPVNNQAFSAFFPQLICHDCPIQPGSHDQIIIFFHFRLSFCTVLSFTAHICLIYSSITRLIRSVLTICHLSLFCTYFLFYHLQIRDYALNC